MRTRETAKAVPVSQRDPFGMRWRPIAFSIKILVESIIV